MLVPLLPVLLLGCREDLKAKPPRDGGLACQENERIIDGVCAFVCDRNSDCATGQRCNLFTGACVPDNSEPDAGPPPVPCTRGAKRCSGNNQALELCNENGVWTTIRTCSPGYCLNEVCLECEPGASTCKPNTASTLLVCNEAGTDTAEVACAAGASC